jgi:hypothetical protein
VWVSCIILIGYMYGVRWRGVLLLVGYFGLTDVELGNEHKKIVHFVNFVRV